MGIIFCRQVKYELGNFIKIVDKYPYQKEGTRIEKFQFKVDRFSVERAHELDDTFDPNLVSVNSFLVAEPNKIVIFENGQQMITNQSNIIERLQMAIQDKMIRNYDQAELDYLVFLEPICKEIYTQTILNIIVQTLINIDLTWSRQNNKSLGVYFDWADYIKEIGLKKFMQKIKQAHNPTGG